MAFLPCTVLAYTRPLFRSVYNIRYAAVWRYIAVMLNNAFLECMNLFLYQNWLMGQRTLPLVKHWYQAAAAAAAAAAADLQSSYVLTLSRSSCAIKKYILCKCFWTHAEYLSKWERKRDVLCSFSAWLMYWRK